MPLSYESYASSQISNGRLGFWRAADLTRSSTSRVVVSLARISGGVFRFLATAYLTVQSESRDNFSRRAGVAFSLYATAYLILASGSSDRNFKIWMLVFSLSASFKIGRAHV